MSNPIYVENISSLQFSSIIENQGKGLLDLLPGQAGKIPAEVAAQDRVRAWIANGRLKELTQEEYLDFIEKQEGELEAKEAEPKSTSFEAERRVTRGPDGTTVIVPGIDQLPEIDRIPDPDVVNLDGFIGIKPPVDDEPLVERAGDVVVLNKSDLKVATLSLDGTVPQMPGIEKAPLLAVPPKPSVEVDPNLIPTGTVTPANLPPLVDLPSSVAVASDPVSIHQAAEVVLGMKAWRQQLKAVKASTDISLLMKVAEATKYEPVKIACQERIVEISK
jgi:hypothetical protein